MKNSLTPERLREVLSYDADRGVFMRRTSISNRFKAGEVAGRVMSDGYIRIKVDGREYQAHRLAWLYTHALWPTDQLDHINGDKADNRLANLREASNGENQQNRRGAQCNSVSGLIGASPHKRAGRWQSTIRIGGRTKHLGLFNTAEEAHAAYLKAKVELHPFQTLVETA